MTYWILVILFLNKSAVVLILQGDRLCRYGESLNCYLIDLEIRETCGFIVGINVILQQ